MGSSEKVAGSRIAIATAAPTPGIAPIMTPPTDPMIRAKATSQRTRSSTPEKKVSMPELLEVGQEKGTEGRGQIFINRASRNFHLQQGFENDHDDKSKNCGRAHK